ncbi:hypothetical protein FRC17_010361 [Serendipita sp. 399]|nr:hypothetical protein FRC17_010361 [Serendipita sp. 399]
MTKTSSLRQQVVAQLNGVRYKMPELTDTIELAVDAIYKASWGNDTDHHYNTDHYYLDLVDTTEVLIQAVVGRGGVYMQRWKSFKFAPSTDSLYKEAFACKTLWLTFRYPTPNLETFTVSRPVSLQPLRLFDGCFPDLTAVRHFTLRDTHGFASANLSRHLLTTAVIHRDPSELNLEALSSCLSLQELTIVQLSGLPLSIPRDIPLPSLKRMTLEGDVSALANVTFQTPSLERLKLECGCVQEMPKVEAHSVVWAPTGRKFLDSMVKFVQCVLGRVKAMETLTLKCEPVDGLNVAVRGMVEKAFGTGDYSRVVKFVVGKGETDELCIKSGWIP